MLLATKKSWEQAGRGDTLLVVAALITRVAVARFEGVERRLKLLCHGSDPEVLRKKMMMRVQDAPIGLGVLFVLSDNPVNRRFTTIVASAVTHQAKRAGDSLKLKLARRNI